MYSIDLKMINQIIGRVLLASLFVSTAIKTILTDFGGFSAMIASKNIPYPALLAILVLGLKLIGGLSIVFDSRFSKMLNFLLIIFMVVATVLFHNAFKDPQQFNNMMKNIAIIGGLFLLLENQFIGDIIKKVENVLDTKKISE